MSLDLESVRAAHGGTETLSGIDLTAAKGELLVLLGPSGAGKSTLLRVIAGLHPTAAGVVRIAGRDVTALSPGERDVSMVFQSYALFPHLSVIDNIGFGLRARGVSRTEARRRSQEAATVAGCDQVLPRRPDQLSGGERQRVALARALVREPALFLLDEPLSNLDAESRVRTRVELRALHDRVGATMVHVTHDQTEALAIADRIAVLHDGRIEQIGTPDEIWRRPATTFVAGFVGSPAMNLLPGDGPWRVPGGHRIGIRPEAVRLAATGSGHAATVTGMEVIGEDAWVRLRIGDHPLVARVPASSRPEPGAAVVANATDADLHAFDVDGKRVP
ncbi:Glycerol-3-phosphate ABC transporter, ATP-binding protein UgpC (TC 3.A.1.1.3) [Alloactinosynnema sp. L-07]|uniref:ABC transporter ATP-binding protein n=1 Tax=Alloactinosynnema sp. L-07 TaxID=1653480 RepID=UPI00065EF085|nr:ABC transporter ATP-binding protein [Alloactinosynnema sp. L-07]CRK56079.1 Glycerol-3-phosphate ABC transporter, ATP-binding protein UgpC (TC 3.A.1.1.3) [Alloactinosynnema sp. L-07]